VKNYDEIIYEKKSNVATITFNRPDHLNSLTRNLMAEVGNAMEEVQTDQEVKVVVFRGAGRAFCAGAYLDDVLPIIKKRSQIIEMVRMFAKGIGAIRNCGKPTVAAIHGYCTAGGFEIMCNCDFAIATEDAKIGDYHMQKALMAGAGAIPLLVRIVGSRIAKEILMSGRLMTGKEAYELGLLNRLAKKDKIDETLNEFLPLFTERSIVGLSHVKFTVESALDADLTTACALESLACASLLSSDAAQEGVDAFLNKRDPQWPQEANWTLRHGNY